MSYQADIRDKGYLNYTDKFMRENPVPPQPPHGSADPSSPNYNPERADWIDNNPGGPARWQAWIQGREAAMEHDINMGVDEEGIYNAAADLEELNRKGIRDKNIDNFISERTNNDRYRRNALDPPNPRNTSKLANAAFGLGNNQPIAPAGTTPINQNRPFRNVDNAGAYTGYRSYAGLSTSPANKNPRLLNSAFGIEGTAIPGLQPFNGIIGLNNPGYGYNRRDNTGLVPGY